MNFAERRSAQIEQIGETIAALPRSSRRTGLQHRLAALRDDRWWSKLDAGARRSTLDGNDRVLTHSEHPVRGTYEAFNSAPRGLPTLADVARETGLRWDRKIRAWIGDEQRFATRIEELRDASLEWLDDGRRVGKNAAAHRAYIDTIDQLLSQLSGVDTWGMPRRVFGHVAPYARRIVAANGEFVQGADGDLESALPRHVVEALRSAGWTARRRSSPKASKPPAKAPRQPAKASKRKKPGRRGTCRQQQLIAAMPGQVVTLDDVARAGCYSPGMARLMAKRMTESGLLEPAPGGVWRKTTAGQVCGSSPSSRDRQAPPHPAAADTVFDSEGRPYRVRWVALPKSAIVASHDADGRAVEGYPRELQARDRSSASSRVQVQRIAAELEPYRVLAPSSSVTESAPVVWQEQKHRYLVVSGNGRTAALEALDPKKRAEYLKAARELFPSIEIPRGGLIVRELVGVGWDEAVQLAGASQASSAAALSVLEQAVGVARAVDVRGADELLALGPVRWTKPVRAEDWLAFAAANNAWTAALFGRLDAARRPSVEGDPGEAALFVTDVMVGALPISVVRGGLGDRLAEQALRGALPGIWTVEALVRGGQLDAGWSLLDALPDARRLYQMAGRKGIAQLARDVAADAENLSLDLVDDELPTLGELDRLAVALGVALLRAGRRADPQAAAAGYVARYVDEALDQNRAAGDLFGAVGPTPADVLSRIVRWRDPRRRKNPGSVVRLRRLPAARRRKVARELRQLAAALES